MVGRRFRISIVVLAIDGPRLSGSAASDALSRIADTLASGRKRT